MNAQEIAYQTAYEIAHRAVNITSVKTMEAINETLERHNIVIPESPSPDDNDDDGEDEKFGTLCGSIAGDVMQFAAVYRRQLLREFLREFRSGKEILPEQTVIPMSEPLSFEAILNHDITDVAHLIIMNSQIHPMDTECRDKNAMAKLPDGWVLCDVSLCDDTCTFRPGNQRFCLIYIEDGVIADGQNEIYLEDNQVPDEVWAQHKKHFKAHPELIKYNVILSAQEKAKYLAELKK